MLCIRHFHEHFKQQHVDPLLLTSTSGKATATCVCLLTPDGERTMRTHLGASSELESVGQLPEGWTHNCRLLHCEGYCLYKLELTRGAMRAAKQSGAEVDPMANSHTSLGVTACLREYPLQPCHGLPAHTCKLQHEKKECRGKS